jgi:hypothetical protein
LHLALEFWNIISGGRPISDYYPIPQRTSYFITGPQGMSHQAEQSEMEVVAEIHPHPGTSTEQQQGEPHDSDTPEDDTDQGSIDPDTPSTSRKGLQHSSRFLEGFNWAGTKAIRAKLAKRGLEEGEADIMDMATSVQQPEKTNISNTEQSS